MKPSLRVRPWILYVAGIAALSATAYTITTWLTSERPDLAPASKPKVTWNEYDVPPSPPVYDTVSPLKQQDR